MRGRKAHLYLNDANRITGIDFQAFTAPVTFSLNANVLKTFFVQIFTIIQKCLFVTGENQLLPAPSILLYCFLRRFKT